MRALARVALVDKIGVENTNDPASTSESELVPVASFDVADKDSDNVGLTPAFSV